MLTLSDVANHPATRQRFRGPEHTIVEMRKAVMGPRGEGSVVVHNAVSSLIRKLQPKDYLSEILAVRHFVAEKVRYKNDPVGVEYVQDPQRMLEDIAQHGSTTGDCDDGSTLMAAMTRCLGRETEWITVGFGPPGKYSHVFTRAREPKSKQWIVLDPVAGTEENRMLARVSTWKAWKID